MILDDLNRMKVIDKSNMLLELQTLPDQLAEAWRIGDSYDLPNINKIDGVTIAGMGGSAIGADILAAYVIDKSSTPVSVIRGYSLPAWVSGENNLVICSSHSGNTEETLSVFQEAVQRNCTLMAVSRGGTIKSLAEEAHSLFWPFSHEGQPRSAVGFSFGILLNLFSRMQLIPDQTNFLDSAVRSMRATLAEVDIDVPVANNLAKRIAGQALGRQPVVLGAEHLEPIARRWKTQINEIAKTWAGFEFMPEANHNTLAGLEYPEPVLEKIYAVFLLSKNYLARNQKRYELTFDQFMVSGLCTDKIQIDDNNKLSEIWQMLLLGDFISYYLAMLYDVDPTPIDSLENFKKAMKL
jgi:glucose/mannose-6-phosphate isomerase